MASDNVLDQFTEGLGEGELDIDDPMHSQLPQLLVPIDGGDGGSSSAMPLAIAYAEDDSVVGDVARMRELLEPLLNRIHDGHRKLLREEADLLLRCRMLNLVPPDVVPTRTQEKGITEPPCIFFVRPKGVLKGEHEVDADGAAWKYHIRPGGDGGSLTDDKHSSEPFRSPYNRDEGIKKVTGTLLSKEIQDITGSIWRFTRVKLPKHPLWDDAGDGGEEGGSSSKKRKLPVGRNPPGQSQDMSSEWRLVIVARKGDSGGKESPDAGAIQVAQPPPLATPDSTTGTVRAQNLFVGGIDVMAKLTELQDEIQQLKRARGSTFEAPTSSNADFAEWMEKLDPDEMMRPGQLVECRSEKISKTCAVCMHA